MPRFKPLLSLLVLAILVWRAPGFVESLYPPPDITYDFYQDWASARNALEGVPIYADISLTIERYLGWQLPENWPARYWRRNFHPPPAVLLTLPFAWLSYQNAFLAWSLVSLAALVATGWLLSTQLRLRLTAMSWLTVGAVLLVWYPFEQQVLQGQINLVLLLLLTATWAAHRSGRHELAGGMLGIATGVKLFPALLFVYFALRREWRVIAAASASFVLVTVVSAVTLGPQVYVTYVADVLPESNQWLSHWHNVSLMSLWTKLFNPGPAGGNIVALWHSASLARIGGLLSCAVIGAVLGRAIVPAKDRTELDLAFGLTVTAMLLISPITWSQNLVLLVLPITLLLASPIRPDPLHWAAFGLVVATLFMPPHKVWGVLIERGWPDGTARPWHVLTALAFQCYAVLALFGLQLWWTARRASLRTSSR